MILPRGCSRRPRPGRLAVVLAACASLAALAAPSPVMAARGDRSPDGVWHELRSDAVAQSALVESFDTPDEYRLVQLDDLALFGILRNAPLEFTAAAQPSRVVLTLPVPEGGFERFRIAESPVLSPDLAA